MATNKTSEKTDHLKSLDRANKTAGIGSKGTVALVLGSGGARGYTHIGVIDVLEEHGYEVVAVSGCSMGAIVGGLYAANKLDAFRQWAVSLNYVDVLKLVDFSFISNGAIRGNKVFNQVRNILSDGKDGDLQIEKLPIPFTAVATDITNSKEVWFQTGSLEKAIRASSAIPSIIKPVRYDEKMYVDGGVLNPLPIAPCVSAHADHIIAVDLNTEAPMPDIDLWLSENTPSELRKPESGEAEKGDWFDSMVNKASRWIDDKLDDRAKKQAGVLNTASTDEEVKESFGMFGTLYKMFDTMQAQISQYKTAGYPPDLLIRVPYDCCETYEFYRAQEMIDLGRYIGEQAIQAYEKGEASLYARQNSK